MDRRVAQGEEQGWWTEEAEDAASLSDLGDPETIPLPTELIVHPGSFSVSTMAVAAMILMLVLTVIAFALAGLIAGLGVGLTLLSMLM